MARWLRVLAAVALLGSACASGGDDDGVASLGGEQAQGASASPSVDPEDALAAFAECMRENGVEDFPDPQIGSDGGITIGVGGGDGSLDEEEAETIDEAMAACQDLLPQGQGPGGISEEDQAAFQDALVAYAGCMRDHGIDMPDPEFSGGGALQQLGEDVDPESPEFQEADEACRPALEEALPEGAPGPGGGGDDAAAG
jgi:hypothetical protein